MAITPITHGSSANDDTGCTIAGLTTTGANLLVLGSTWLQGSATPTVSDSKSNSWTKLTSNYNSPGTLTSTLWWCMPTSVGASHSFTIVGVSVYAPLFLLALSGGNASPLDQKNGNGDDTATIAPGSITPTVPGCAVVSMAGFQTSLVTNPTLAGFTRTDVQPAVGGSSFGGAMAYLIQTSAAATNVAWDTGTGGGPDVTAVQADFKPLVGGGGSPIRRNTTLSGLGAAGPFFQNPLSYHRHPEISLAAYARERARAHRDFLAKVRRAA